METTRQGPPKAWYLGADLTDRYAKGRRPIDVCGLTPDAAGQFHAEFWQWHWDAPELPVQVDSLLPELRGARLTLIDGPQALALPGQTMRDCERKLAAAGKTPDAPPCSGPYAGFVRSSLELFAALAHAGLRPNTPIAETYPGAVWKRLGTGLAKKSSHDGRRQRRELLERMGVRGLTELPSHDRLDACLCALLAAAHHRPRPGLATVWSGLPLQQDSGGSLREGQILTVCTTGESSMTHAENDNAQMLLDELIASYRAGSPRLHTYKGAYQLLFGHSPQPWSQGHAMRVLALAKATTPRTLEGLGQVQLDCFIVAAKSKRPGKGHWGLQIYDEKQWLQAFHDAELLS
ncbi:hypothetical protein DMO17_16265 [Aquipseudomonas alcaligenes]|uniref:DUF429 domain-containing protein n=1 Tax=Aquipseudomonas alcaligenes TaxID=43263 RepID=A0A2V4KV35_AQUAC|nr:DUF429 domain-containing protein [Pseudomonas alcaligenes]PYC22004.1 hypothetical protein DMO17_16265 [Pseudomonas alcaligenes]